MKYSPMLLSEEKEGLPVGKQWSYEPKLDGYRIVAEIGARSTKLFSRNEKDYADHFPDVAEELVHNLIRNRAVVDGVMVGFDDAGLPKFEVLRRKRPNVNFFIFDILELDGKPLINYSLSYRRGVLSEVLEEKGRIRRFRFFDDRDSTVRASQDLGLEGVIAKNKDSLYRQGAKNKDWLKFIFEQPSKTAK